MRHQLRTKVHHACRCASELWSEANSVNCFVVPPSQISCHWFQPVVDEGIFERQIHSAFGRANLQVSPNLSRSADLPTCRFADSFGSAVASPSQFIPSLVPRPVLSQWLRKQSLLKQANLKVASCVLSVQRKALTLNSQPKLKPFTIRHSLFATRCRFTSR